MSSRAQYGTQRPICALVVLFGGLTVVFASVPTVSIGTRSVKIAVVVGVLAGVLLAPAVVSNYRDGERRDAFQWGLFAVGVPVSLTDHAFLPWVGVLSIFASLGVGLEVDRWLFERLSS